jgi:hypothetical protein
MMKGERVAELVRQLEHSPPAGNAEDPLHLVTTTLDDIEDRFSGVPNDPSSPRADDRIWPPIAKYSFAIEGRDDLDGYRQKGHETIIGSNGAILIRSRRDVRIILDKAGLDGRKVNL